MAEGDGVQPPQESVSSEKMSVYTVQRAVEVDMAGNVLAMANEPDGENVWEDIGTVEVPVRSHRKSAVQKALEQFNIPQDSHPSFFRALEAEIAEPIPVTVEQPPAPPARLKVGR